ncbi:MAG TPA: hypothetical protein VL096_12180, partial [Pirellulaceae bacterium]|nr:hypothetical protein [Pirellulaceae bacterium]
SKPLVLSVPVDLAITINERTGTTDQPYTLASLKVGDAVQVEHEPDEVGRHATKLSVTRAMTSVGSVTQVDAKQRSITWNITGSQQRETLPVARQCEISLNGLRLLKKAALTLQDLRPGDEVTLAFDTAITRIDAVRRFVDRGVVKNIAYDVRSIEVQLAGQSEPRTFILPANCELQVPGGSTLDLLRRGDQIEVTHDSPEGNNIAISKLIAQRPGDASKWAIIIHQQKYDDERLTAAATSASSQPALVDVLQTCYAVPRDQVLLLSDESRIRLSKEIPAALTKAAQAKQLIVVYVGRGFADSGGQVFLAPKEFALDRVAASGVPLKWFIEQIEASPASDKLLLFDAGFELGAAPTLTSAEMIATIQGTRSEPGLRTTTVLASGGREALSGGVLLSGYEQALATAFTGGADRNRDLAIDAGELIAFFEQNKGSQPVLFLPNNTPPRLTADAKQSLRSLAAVLNQPKIDVTTVRRAYEDAASLSAKQPEAGAIYALLLLKARQFPESLRRAEEVKAAHPNYLPIYEINLWNRFGSRDYAAGVTEMAQLATRLATPAKENELAYSADNALRALRLAGQLREYAAQAVEDRPPRPEAIEAVDAAVAKLSAPQVAAFQAGRTATRKVLADFDAQAKEIETRLETLANEDDKSALTKVKFEKRQLRHYVSFGFDGIAQSILAGLDE